MFRVPADAVDMRVPREYVLPRGWQPFAIVGLIPLWWLMGASFFMWPLIAMPLIAAMVVRGRIRAPRRFGIWLLFILWVIASGVELNDPNRALAWGWRLSFYVAGAAVLLYLVNVPERRISTRSIVNAMAALWVMVVAGGWLGVAFPGMNFASPLEKLLPHGLTQNQYVYAHVHLEFAQIQHFLGFPIGRPETFFAYTNAWGSAFAILTPCAICAMLQTRSRAWKNVLRLAMAASIVPVVFSLNRGLWLSLGLALMYAMFRFWLRGDFRQAMKVIVAFAVIGAVLVVSPLGNLASSRFSHKTGDTGRVQRDIGAQQQIANSPILGFGAPLGAVQTPTHKQSNLGTESEIFLLVFSHGVPGLALFLIWMFYTLFRSGKWRSSYGFWAHITILVACIQLPYYDITERIPLVMVAAAIAYREIARNPEPEPSTRELRRARLQALVPA
jgi:polysaccharide biosynthesis protein PslJ